MAEPRAKCILLPFQAVQLDTVDGLSWSILGNAYFAHFFNVSQNPRTLKQSMSAYRQAEKDPVARDAIVAIFHCSDMILHNTVETGYKVTVNKVKSVLKSLF